ncbi:hypothetical protein BDA96_07G011000 [Sorghum bicolor]|uniref:Uncharacterized protein n=2 Tax=Sorghum bicolor TaxID=4558 RepID=C5YLW1_SORBI|nr:hypothetical protein SORBI_3007G010400 [Sorghum bicolor]KAG0522137.1 hypothetical protein BDA96_07G011000 [Sorghum bicolor]
MKSQEPPASIVATAARSSVLVLDGTLGIQESLDHQMNVVDALAEAAVGGVRRQIASLRYKRGEAVDEDHRLPAETPASCSRVLPQPHRRRVDEVEGRGAGRAVSKRREEEALEKEEEVRRISHPADRTAVGEMEQPRSRSRSRSRHLQVRVASSRSRPASRARRLAATTDRWRAPVSTTEDSASQRPSTSTGGP